MRFFFNHLGKRFKDALRGLLFLCTDDLSFQEHLVICLPVVLGVVCYRISGIRLVMVILAIGIVLAGEAVNSALERLCNWTISQTTPRGHSTWYQEIHDIKDIVASAVLLASCVAAAIGVWVFGPHLWFTVRHVL